MSVDNVSERRILVAVDATKDRICSDAIEWYCRDFARPWDSLRILGILSNPASSQTKSIKLGYKARTEPGMFSMSDNKRKDEIAKIFAANEGYIEDLKSSCRKNGVSLSTAIIPGYPAWPVLLQEASTFNPDFVILDRFMKKETKYILEKVQCKVLLMSKVGKGEFIKISTPDESELFDLFMDVTFIDSSAVNCCFESEMKSSNDLLKPSQSSSKDEHLTGSDTHKLETPTPICVNPKPRAPSELMELLGGSQGLDTDLFKDYVQPEHLSRRDQGVHNEVKKNVNGGNEVNSVERLHHYFSDENNKAKQGTIPLCSLCNNKSPRFGTQPIAFLYSQIEEATNRFSRENLLAEGGFGYVYKGVFPDGQLVAVKQHKLASRQGDREFKAEVEVLSSAQHRNLVTLLGYCTEGGRRILVYEYVCNGSLHWHLSPNGPKPLDWPSRQKIALGAARGLRYLHEECRIGCIVHRDVRPHNILITHDFTALVGDFGLARWQARGDMAEQTRVIGTIGYVAPEYAETGHITEKADVYSFGLVLLEIITGHAAFDSRLSGQHLPDWAYPLLAARAAHELLDKDIDQSTVDEYELINMVTAANLCIQKDPNKRPKMSQVVRHLEGDDRESTPLSPISELCNMDIVTNPRTSVQSRPSTTVNRMFSVVDEKQFKGSKLKKSISYNEML